MTNRHDFHRFGDLNWWIPTAKQGETHSNALSAQFCLRFESVILYRGVS